MPDSDCSTDPVDVQECLGRLVDTLDNYAMYFVPGAFDAFPLAQRFEALGHGIQAARDEVKRLYFALGGEDVWGTDDEQEEG